MFKILFWLYLINAILLIDHEIDSAYWQEWNLFSLPGGINFFLIIHIPLLFFVLYGLVLIREQHFIGLIFSLLLAVSGLFAFMIHTYFIKKGHPEFKTIISQFILISVSIVSVTQLFITIILMF
jgi:hypothetical protein